VVLITIDFGTLPMQYAEAGAVSTVLVPWFASAPIGPVHLMQSTRSIPRTRQSLAFKAPACEAGWPKNIRTRVFEFEFSGGRTRHVPLPSYIPDRRGVDRR
jgi:hypothetical protein